VTTYWCERAWVGSGEIVTGLVVDIADTHISSTHISERPPAAAVRLRGLTIPGLANCHSHAFHRALRGRTQRERGTFWTWRETMYDVASRLDPDTYYDLAYATYREMVLTGITAVGEFHYLHHDRDGRGYSDPNAMGLAMVQAARDAGLRICLLDTCYLSAGFGAPVSGVQTRFSDGSANRWVERVAALSGDTGPDVVRGAAIHSVRAVPRTELTVVATALPEAPLHVHLSEQQAENDACLERYRLTPTRLLAEEGVLGEHLTAVHATHLTSQDVGDLGSAGCFVDFCPTTERDLADGVGPSRPLVDAGTTITLGSDSHAVIDMYEEMRALELDERLSSQHRGSWQPEELLVAATRDGHRSLGFSDAGRIAPGHWADLVTLDIESPRTAGTGGGAETVVFAAGPADVSHVVASGWPVVLDPRAVGGLLDRAIDAVVAS
jgi:formiminoglutamate deiminase